MPTNVTEADFLPCAAIGVRRGDRLIAGFVYNHYIGHQIEVTVASVDPRWTLRRDIIRALFIYPFVQLGVQRLICTVSVHNKKAIKLANGLGFTREGVLRKGYDGVNDAYLFSMLREECDWKVFT
jgi:RimJ/RimL family protein N-acetyltransferase